MRREDGRVSRGTRRILPVGGGVGVSVSGGRVGRREGREEEEDVLVALAGESRR